ncbi:hypothetical protein M2162_008792 [Streptomyces sp. SAI-041]|nr:hypothetical protein [Streptomyces sp. SAI-041]
MCSTVISRECVVGSLAGLAALGAVSPRATRSRSSEPRAAPGTAERSGGSPSPRRSTGTTRSRVVLPAAQGLGTDAELTGHRGDRLTRGVDARDLVPLELLGVPLRVLASNLVLLPLEAQDPSLQVSNDQGEATRGPVPCPQPAAITRTRLPFDAHPRERDDNKYSGFGAGPRSWRTDLDASGVASAVVFGSTVRPVRLVVAALVRSMTSWLIRGLPCEFMVMWEKSRCLPAEMTRTGLRDRLGKSGPRTRG